METILQKAWNMKEGFNVVEINSNEFMFKFSSEAEYNRILQGKPWTINGCLLNLLERSKYKSCEEFDFSHCLIWIQIRNVLMEAICLENAIMIEGYIGEMMLAEDSHFNGRFLRSFLRARVVLDLKNPLAYGFWMPRPDGKKEEAKRKRRSEDMQKTSVVPNSLDEDLFSIKINKPLPKKEGLSIGKDRETRELDNSEIIDSDRANLRAKTNRKNRSALKEMWNDDKETWKRPHRNADTKGVGDFKIHVTTPSPDTVRLNDKVVEPRLNTRNICWQ
ncbi:hypothetical protein K1719_029374 [Acacia pycnantha]|nr:hypothetical protein K1719_029374 [Acacia pycnantha]